MTIHSFETVLVRPEGVGTWTYLNIPPDISATFGSKGQIKVKGTINGYPFRSTALPRGDGSHYLVVGKNIRDQIKSIQGDTVKVILELDVEERQVEIPEDLAQALDNLPQVKSAFNQLSYSHKKEYVNWILGARQAETRQRRIEKALMLLSQGKKLRG
jgi:hypothetical protein